MKFKYENLEIWQLAMDLVETIYRILKKFPVEERFELCSQGRRAVTSVALQISEGSGRHSNKDFANFLNRSITSLQEVDTVLKIALRLKYITNNDPDLLIANQILEKLYYKSIAYRKKLLKNNS